MLRHWTNIPFTIKNKLSIPYSHNLFDSFHRFIETMLHISTLIWGPDGFGFRTRDLLIRHNTEGEMLRNLFCIYDVNEFVKRENLSSNKIKRFRINSTVHISFNVQTLFNIHVCYLLIFTYNAIIPRVVLSLPYKHNPLNSSQIISLIIFSYPP